MCNTLAREDFTEMKTSPCPSHPTTRRIRELTLEHCYNIFIQQSNTRI